MNRQQKTFTPASFILPLAVTALVIFLASTANAQDASAPLPDLPAPIVQEPPTLKPILAPHNDSAQMPKPEDVSKRTTVNASLSAEATVTSSTSASTTTDTSVKTSADFNTMRAAWAKSVTERQIMLERKRAELASSTVERKAALNSAAQERIKQRTGKLTSVLSEALARMKGFSSNLHDRAESISSRGADTTEAIALLDQVDTLITQAETSLSGIDVNIEYTLTSESPRENWIDTKAQFQTTAEIIRAIRPLLRDVVDSLKGSVKIVTDTKVKPI